MLTKNVAAAGTLALVASGILVAVSPVTPAAAACDPDMTVNMLVLLGGPYDPTTDLMRDGLRTGFVPGNPVLPTTEPYSSIAGYLLRGGEGTTITLGDTTTAGPANAPVDWIVIELRSASDPAVIVATDISVVNRDGTVVAPTFEVVPGSYYVAVRHRNHLGVMTALPVVFDGVTGPTIDFTDPATPLWVRTEFLPSVNYTGSESQLVEPGVRALWPGDANGSKVLLFQGTQNETEIITEQVRNHPDNPAGSLSFNLGYGYYSGDINMDGKVTLEAPNADPLVIENSVLTYPSNPIRLPFYSAAREQVPPASVLLSDENDPVYSCTDSNDDVGDGTGDEPELAATGPATGSGAFGLAGALLLSGLGALTLARRRRTTS